MDSHTNEKPEDLRAIQVAAEIALEKAIQHADAVARMIAQRHKEDNLVLLSDIKFNHGEVGYLSGRNVMEVLIHRAALRQLYVNHDQRRKPDGNVVA